MPGSSVQLSSPDKYVAGRNAANASSSSLNTGAPGLRAGSSVPSMDRAESGADGPHRSNTVVIMALDQGDRLVLNQRGAGGKTPANKRAMGVVHQESLFGPGVPSAAAGRHYAHSGAAQHQRGSIHRRAVADEFSEDHIDYWTLRFREPVVPVADPDATSTSPAIAAAAATAVPKSGKLMLGLESGFLSMFFDRYASYVQKAILTAVVIWALYVINDIQKNAEGKRANYHATLIIRAVNCVIGVVCAALLSTPQVKKRKLLMPIVGFAMITFGLAQIVFGLWDENELDPAYSVIMILIPSTSSTLFKQRFIFTVVFQFALLLLYILLTYAFDKFHAASDLILTAIGLFFANILFAVHAYRREYKMRRDYLMKMQLEREETRSQNLLLRMLPASVISKLREGSDFIYYKHEAVSILFSHVHDFDTHVHSMTAMQVIRMLNTLFTRYDELTDIHGVYKVETIGDVYLVCAGCPVEYVRSDHLEAVAGFALDMVSETRKFMVEHVRDVAAAAARKLGVAQSAVASKGHGNAHVSKLSPIQLRLGINTGAIISGVVGVKYPRFRLMGDTINTASRMSTTASADQIQLTTRAWESLNKSWYDTAYRGEIAVKGKGQMKTYLLLGRVHLTCPPPTNVHQVQLQNGTTHVSTDAFETWGEKHDAAHASAPAHTTNGGILVDTPQQLKAREATNRNLHLHVPNGESASGGLDKQGPSSSNLLAGSPSPGGAVAMLPAELPGVPEMLRKLKQGGDPGGSDDANSRGSRSSSISSLTGPDNHQDKQAPERVGTPSSLASVEDALADVLDDQGGEGQVVHIVDRAGHRVADEQVIGDGKLVAGKDVAEADVQAPAIASPLAAKRTVAPSPRTSPNKPNRSTASSNGFAASPAAAPSAAAAATTATAAARPVNVHGSTAHLDSSRQDPDSSSQSSKSKKKMVITALDHQSTFKSVRLFSFGPMNAILRPRGRKWWQVLDQSFITDPTLEFEFLHVYSKEMWSINRAWVNFLWIFLLPLSIYDTMNSPEISSAIVGYSWLIRLVGLAIGCWFYYFSQRYQYLKHMQQVTCLVVSTVGVVYVWTTALTGALLKSYGVSFVLVGLCIICMFVGLRFAYAVLSVSIIMCMWIIASTVSEGTLAGIASVLFAASIMYLETAYNTEAEARHDFVRFRKLYHERMSTHAFLSNMLPPSVFEGLKREDQALVAHERIDADVLFSDIVGFTSIASTMKPEDVVAVLNVMFATYDTLAIRHQVYKVETIGDAYVACTNVVERRDDHTRCLVDFALAMQKATKTMMTPTQQQIVIRVGIHTGNLIAGVVGRKMPRYHLFGETVTIAEEMEQKGVPGMVALSETAYRSMPPGSLCEYETKELDPVPFGSGVIHRWTVSTLPKKDGKKEADTGAAGEVRMGGGANTKRTSLLVNNRRTTGGTSGAFSAVSTTLTRTTAPAGSSGGPTHMANSSQVPSAIYMPGDDNTYERSTPQKDARAAASPTTPGTAAGAFSPSPARPTAIRVRSMDEDEKPGSPSLEDPLTQGEVLVPGLYQDDDEAAASPVDARSSPSAPLESYLKAQAQAHHTKTASRSTNGTSSAAASSGPSAPLPNGHPGRVIRQETRANSPI